MMAVAAVSIGAACAGEDTVTVNGLDFNIPDGYEKTNSTGNTVYFSDDNGGEFSINVDESSSLIIRDPATVNGREGSIYTGVDGSSTEGQVKFVYQQDGKVVTIKTTDETLLEQIIPEN